MNNNSWQFFMSFIGFYFFAVLVTQGFSAEKPFYEGKTLTVLINYAAGGPTDVEGRVLARHLGKHIAGQPIVVVQNMGGAGGIIGTNYLGQVANRRRGASPIYADFTGRNFGSVYSAKSS